LIIILIGFGLGIFSTIFSFILYLKYKINIMETYKGSQAYLSKQVNVNGKVISDQTINAGYDGNNLSIDMYDNGKHFYSQLNNNDIASILSYRASSLPLEKRLINDFSIKNKPYKKTSKNNNKSKKLKSKTHKHKRNTNRKR